MNRPRFLCLLLALVTVVIYLPAHDYDFVNFDDQDYVSRNSMVQKGITLAGIKWAFTSFHASNWHPLTWLSLMLDCQLFGPNPGAMHLVSALIHALNAVLLFLLVRRLIGALWPAAFVAALFAWHPLRVESVAWISERKDVLSSTFWLLTLWFYADFARGNRRSYFLSLGCFVLGLLAKPMLVTLPFVLLLLDYWPLRRFADFKLDFKTCSRLIVEKWPFFLLTIVSCLVTFNAQRGAVAPLVYLPLTFRIANAVISAASYVFKTIWPLHLTVMYPFQIPPSRLTVALCAIFLLVISVVVVTQARRRPFFLVGWLWYLGTLVPVIGIVQVGSQAMADRYTYIPLMGILLALAAFAQEFFTAHKVNKSVVGTAAFVVLLACMALTERQLPVWRDSKSLFGHAVKVTKNNAIAELNFGVALENEGKKNEAIPHYFEAVRIAPGLAQAHNNLAKLLDEAGRNDEAIAEYERTLQLDPDSEIAHENLGILLGTLGRFDEAMQHFREAAKIVPHDPRPHYLMARAALRQAKTAEAIAHFRDALRLDANDIKTLVHLARLLAANSDDSVRNGAEAVRLAERANELTEWSQPYPLDTLAAAYAEAGRFADAVRTIQIAISLSEKAGETDAVAEMQERLKLYKSGQPYREAFTKNEKD